MNFFVFPKNAFVLNGTPITGKVEGNVIENTKK
jgi:hypothetical protein